MGFSAVVFAFSRKGDAPPWVRMISRGVLRGCNGLATSCGNSAERVLVCNVGGSVLFLCGDIRRVPSSGSAEAALFCAGGVVLFLRCDMRMVPSSGSAEAALFCAGGVVLFLRCGMRMVPSSGSAEAALFCAEGVVLFLRERRMVRSSSESCIEGPGLAVPSWDEGKAAAAPPDCTALRDTPGWVAAGFVQEDQRGVSSEEGDSLASVSSTSPRMAR